MQGFNYSQLYSALQVWPYKSSAQYLASLNRIIFLGELRLMRDMDLDIFDVLDQTIVNPGDTTILKPQGSTPIAFTAPINLGDTSSTLAATWTLPTGVYVVTFSDNEIQAVTFTNGDVTATWPNPMAAAVTENAVVAPLFVVETELWTTYNGVPNNIVTKRSYAFVNNYSQALQGQPKYYADLDQNTWVFAPAADANTSAFSVKYLRRPVSIVAAGNTFFGDIIGDALFVACLMESEQWLKADDRYADMKSKYATELIPGARGELMSAWRKGQYTPLAPTASVPGPPPAPAAAA